MNERIKNALMSDVEYAEKCLAQRQPGEGGAGSRFLAETTLAMLCAADWQPYEHPEIEGPAVGFRAEIPGRLGIVRLDSLEPDRLVVLCDPKETGFVEACVEGELGPEVPFTVLLLGPSLEGDKEVIWTFFPGEPIQPSRVETSDFPDGTPASAAAAIELGLEWAKII